MITGNTTDINCCITQYRKTVPIHGINMDIEKQYRYIVQIQKNNTVLKNSINNGFKLFTTIKKKIIVRLSSSQAGRKVSDHPSKVKQAGAKLTYSTRRHYVRRSYRSRHG